MKRPVFSQKQLKKKYKPLYVKLNKLLHGGLDIFRYAWGNFIRERAPETAGSMAYFSILSLFPLVIVIISLASFVLKSQFIQDQILGFIIDFVPVTPDLIITNIESVLEKRETVGLIATLGLTWSATSMFNILAINIDRAWPKDASHSFVERRIMGFAILMGIAVILIVFWMFRTILSINLIEELVFTFEIPLFDTTLWDIVELSGPRLFRFLMYWIMYQWIPKAEVRPREAFWGALFTLISTEILTLVMNWYLASQWMRYELVYGSLGSIIALMLWIYLISYFVFLGAHISSGVAHVHRNRQIKHVEDKAQESES